VATRIGTFLCNCGGSLNNIDFEAAAKEVGKLPGVARVDLSSNLCFEEGKQRMISSIRGDNLDRVVVAACSPDFQEPGFQETIEKAGLNRCLLSMANIREQCSWAHTGDVTAKAVKLVEMAVNRVRLLQPLQTKEVLVSREVLVVGGGFSAVSVAVQLSRIGFSVTLLEEGKVLGAGMRELEGFYGFDASQVVNGAEMDERIEILTSCRLLEVAGRVGDFTVKISKDGQEIVRKYGAVVIASGYQTGLASSSEAKSDRGIVSQEEFCRMLGNPSLARQPKTVGFLFDFSDESSRFSTWATLNNALTAKRKWGSEVYVFYKSIKVDSQGTEKLYREARDCGVVFVKCEAPPSISPENGHVQVKARDVFVGEDVVLASDVLVAEELYLPAEGTEALSSLLNVRRDSRGFFQDENVHIYPVASERKGIFFVGECRGDLGMPRVLADISSVVAEVHALLSSGKMRVEAEKVKADPQKCVACLTCIRVCPHGAIQLVRADGGKEVAGISDAACFACGVCAGICPAKAIVFQGYRDEEILAQIEAI